MKYDYYSTPDLSIYVDRLIWLEEQVEKRRLLVSWRSEYDGQFFRIIIEPITDDELYDQEDTD